MKCRCLILLPAAFFVALSLLSCKPTQSSIRPQPDVVVSPAPLEQIDKLPAAGISVPNMREHADRMGFWLKLAVPPTDQSEGRIAMQAYGYSVSEYDYVNALQAFLAGRANAPALESEFRQQLRADLMLLRWMEETNQLGDVRQRVEARNAVRNSLVEFIIEDQLNGVDVSDADAQRLYESRLQQYMSPEKVQVRIILVPTTEEAEDILRRLGAGESFGPIAAEVSRHDSRSRSGELEPFARGTYISEMEDKAFQLAPGEIGLATAPVGTFIIEKIAGIPATIVPFSQMRDELKAELRQNLREQKRREFLEQVNARMSRFEDE